MQLASQVHENALGSAAAYVRATLPDAHARMLTRPALLPLISGSSTRPASQSVGQVGRRAAGGGRRAAGGGSSCAPADTCGPNRFNPGPRQGRTAARASTRSTTWPDARPAAYVMTHGSDGPRPDRSLERETCISGRTAGGLRRLRSRICIPGSTEWAWQGAPTVLADSRATPHAGRGVEQSAPTVLADSRATPHAGRATARAAAPLLLPYSR
jgi:hypothetical protein